jgi:hypothetical protein
LTPEEKQLINGVRKLATKNRNMLRDQASRMLEILGEEE